MLYLKYPCRKIRQRITHLCVAILNRIHIVIIKLVSPMVVGNPNINDAILSLIYSFEAISTKLVPRKTYIWFYTTMTLTDRLPKHFKDSIEEMKKC
mgnify:CR=1 FL=1